MSEFNVGNAFDTLCSRLRFSDDDQNTISTRYHAITKRINTDFWGSSSDVNHSFYVGSYGRDSEIYTSDIDMLVVLPSKSMRGLMHIHQMVSQRFSKKLKKV